MGLFRFLQENSGVSSSIRLALMILLFTYVGVVIVIVAIWTAKAFIDVPDWGAAIKLVITTGSIATGGGLLKVAQKKYEVQKETDTEINSKI